MKWPRWPWLQAFRKLPCHKLPRNAATIRAEWPIKEGGIQAAAWTDANGIAYLGVKTLNRIGKTSGWHDWHCCDTFTSDMVAGFIEDRPLIMHVNIQVTAAGLDLVVCLPPNIECGNDFAERHFSPWGSGSPTISFTLIPTLDPYAANSFPTA
jgi:hypothetical protein